MRILVSVPGVSHAALSKRLDDLGFVACGEFKPTSTTLDAFPDELGGLKIPYMWGVNIPHWPMKANGTKGVAGPGRPQDELFHPAKLQRELGRLCGRYDKWRPYPAETLSNYAMSMARRFCKKRCRMFSEIAGTKDGEVLFYVEHSPASIAHLSMPVAIELANLVLKHAVVASGKQPSEPFAVFSPYGADGAPGFFASNGGGDTDLGDWSGIRRFMAGQG